MATGTVEFRSVEDYLKSTAEADPKTAFDILLAQNARLREENERENRDLKQKADVELDEHGRFKPKNLAGVWRLAVMYAKSQMVPDHYKGKTEDCAIAIQMAIRCDVDILTFLQSSYIVHGKPGIEAKLAIAMLIASGQIKGRIRWKFEGQGKDRKCTAMVTDALTGDVIEESVTWAMVEAEGWASKLGSKWKTIPEMMFKYRSAMWLIRTSYPDVLMGMRTVDELEDTVDAIEAGAQNKRTVGNLDELTSHLLGEATPTAPTPPAPQQPVETTTPSAASDDSPTSRFPPVDVVAYENEMRAATTLTEINTIYERTFGPEAAFEYTEEQANEAVGVRNFCRDKLKAAKK